MTFDQIIEIIGQIATWITVFFVSLTLREMGKQRKASQKPELIVPNIRIYGYSRDIGELFIASHWTNEKLRNNIVTVGGYPKVILYNIGAGAAKEIKIKWDYNLQDPIKTIQDYCKHNSIPIVVSGQGGVLQIEYEGCMSSANIDADNNYAYAYIMPASVFPQGLKIDLPCSFINVISILIFLRVHKMQNDFRQKKEILTLPNSLFEIPPLKFELRYEDISGDRYTKKFDVKLDPVMMEVPLERSENSFNEEPICIGEFEFKERS